MITGSLQKKSGYYYIVYRCNSKKQKWVSTKVKIGKTKKDQMRTEHEAYLVMEEYLKKLNSDVEDSDYFQMMMNTANLQLNDEMFFTAYLKSWLKDVLPTIKLSTAEEYERMVNNILIPYFEPLELQLKDLKPVVFTRYFNFLKEYGGQNHKGLSRKTVLNVKAILSSACKYAFENDVLPYNPVERAHLPVYSDLDDFEPVIYTPAQMKKLLDYAEETNSNACLFLYLAASTGARRGEIMGLTWDNVDFDNNTIYICQNRVGTRKTTLEKMSTPKTRNSYRTLAIPPKVRDLLLQEKLKQQKNRELLKSMYYEYDYDYIIRQNNGKVYGSSSYMNRLISKMMDENDLPHCRLHDFRHFVASTLFESNVSLKDISKQLGHGMTSTTERIYIHPEHEVNVNNAEIMAKVIGI